MMVVPITRAIVAEFVPTMANREELETLTGMDAVGAIIDAAERSAHTFAGVTMDGPAFLGGVADGRVWMLANPTVARHRKFYLRATREQVTIMRGMFPRLHCWVAATYPKSLRWLEWLGFTVGPGCNVDGRVVHLAELKS